MDRMNLTLDIQTQDVGPRRVNVRRSLVVANLIATIKDKFNLDGNFELRTADGRQVLPEQAALDQVGVSDGTTLLCLQLLGSTGTLEAIRRGVREGFSKAYRRVYLQEARTLGEYDLYWQPAVIGRRDHKNPANNRLLCADLEDMEELPTVSRHHACITEENGTFYVESVQGRNPTYLDGNRLRPGEKRPLAAGTVIQVGRVWLTFNLVT
jgi:hypothetical protein